MTEGKRGGRRFVDLHSYPMKEGMPCLFIYFSFFFSLVFLNHFNAKSFVPVYEGGEEELCLYSLKHYTDLNIEKTVLTVDLLSNIQKSKAFSIGVLC